jgi:DNA-binding IscR family transcriptional regulator
MKNDSRLSGVLHLLLHLAESDEALTSEVLAKAMATNPVVIRRILGGLREHGLVGSERGRGGGWLLAKPLSAITLRDVYEALGRPSIFAIGDRNEAPECLVEQAVNDALGGVLRTAEAVLLAGLAAVTLDQVDADVHRRLAARFGAASTELAHVHG